MSDSLPRPVVSGGTSSRPRAYTDPTRDSGYNRSIAGRRRSWLKVFRPWLRYLAIVVTLCVVLVVFHFHGSDNGRSTVPVRQSFRVLSTTGCLDTSQADIGQLPQLASDWTSCHYPEDQEVRNAFTAIYKLSQRSGGVHVPETFKPKVLGWLGNNEEYFRRTMNQTITSVFNRFTHEHTIYNPLRALRPGANDGDGVLEYINQLTEEKARDCDFCRAEQMTASDTFTTGDRVSVGDAISAANVFKYDAFHGLIIGRQHDPLKLSETNFIDMMQTAQLWFNRAHQEDPTFRFPHLMWDLLPKASASQLHPHAQVSLTPDQYYGLMQDIKESADIYDSKHLGRNYFTDLAGIHLALGLGVRYGDAVAIAYITPKKEYEITVMSPQPTVHFFKLLYHLIMAYRMEVGVYAWSMGMFLPEMGVNPSISTIPAYARIIDRGSPTGTRSDISAMELFAASNVNADPFLVMRKLRKSIIQNLPGAE